jgi:hypothetical protein
MDRVRPRAHTHTHTYAHAHAHTQEVTRKQTSKRVWGFNHEMKDPSVGGVAPLDPQRKLNIWVCRIGEFEGQTVLGYPPYLSQNHIAPHTLS